MNRQVLRSGDWQVEWEDGGLRRLMWSGVEIASGLYAAVRDRDWGTVPPRIGETVLTETEEMLEFRFACEHVRDDIDFMWRGTVVLAPRRLRFEFDGIARSSFLRNRIGICVLHSMAFAGKAVRAETESGTVSGHFPEAISPHQPFMDIKAMAYEPVPGLAVRMAFGGDLFEMEDQRNWTDASYKTYCTPLRLPFPVKVEAGERIRQTVDIVIDPASDIQPAQPAAHGRPLALTGETVGRLPEIGFLLAEGPPTDTELARLREAKPSHLHLVLDLTDPRWDTRFRDAVRAANRLDCGIELELLAGDGQSLDDLFRLAADRKIPVRRLMPFRSGTFDSEHSLLAACRERAAKLGLPLGIGGGTRGHYAEFNRAKLPLSLMDFGSYAITPQFHAFDDRSVMETLRAQPVTAADARAKTGKPLYLGPITLKPRLNPVATSGKPVTVEEQRDDRLDSPFCAAWTLGSLAALAIPGVEGITCFETHGPLGLADGDRVRPAHDVFKAVADFRGADIFRIEGVPESAAALGLKRNNRRRILLANLTADPLELTLVPDADFPGPLDVSSKACQSPGSRIVSSRNGLEVVLTPYDVAMVDLV